MESGTLVSSAVTGVDADAPASAPRGERPLRRRPVVAAVVLLAAYVALSWCMSPEGFLGTDTGGKVATVKVMSERGDLDPDVGYWAAAWDPEARVHGLYYTTRVGDRYVQVTSLPMIVAARPLWDLGGYRASLLLPMLGGVATAFAARALARRLGDGEGWTAFWIIGLASPVTIYALDLWEHSLGLALMGWAAVVLVDAVEQRPTWWRGAVAGVLFGAAAAMRTEAFVYAFVMVALACLAIVLGRRRSFSTALATGVSAVVGFALAFGANLVLETVLLGAQIRSSRTGGAATSAGMRATLRIEEALTTLISPFSGAGGSAWALGGLLVLFLGYGASKSTRPRDQGLAILGFVVAGALYLFRVLDGLDFVPGMVVATPFVAVALALGWRTQRTRLVLLLALVPLPLVFAFQFVGGAGPQWAGRYILPSGLLAAVVGIVESRRMAGWARTAVVVFSVGVTALGLSWLSLRSHQVARTGAELEALPADVLISPDGFVFREFGATFGENDWLSAGSPEDLRFAVQVAESSGAASIGLVAVDSPAPPPTFAGWAIEGEQEVPFLTGADLRVTTYCRAPRATPAADGCR